MENTDENKDSVVSVEATTSDWLTSVQDLLLLGCFKMGFVVLLGISCKE